MNGICGIRNGCRQRRAMPYANECRQRRAMPYANECRQRRAMPYARVRRAMPHRALPCASECRPYRAHQFCISLHRAMPYASESRPFRALGVLHSNVGRCPTHGFVGRCPTLVNRALAGLGFHRVPDTGRCPVLVNPRLSALVRHHCVAGRSPEIHQRRATPYVGMNEQKSPVRATFISTGQRPVYHR